jgi:hypothetical protein
MIDYNKYYLLLFIIIITSIIIQVINIKDFFENFKIDDEDYTEFNPDNTIVIADNYGNFNDCNMVIYPLIFDLILKQYKDDKSVTSYLLNNTKKTKLKMYLDPYINYYIFDNKNRNEYKYYEKNGYFVRISPFKLMYDECAWDFNNKTIAYTCMTDYYFIMAIIKGHRLDLKSINLLKIDYRDLSSYEKLFKKYKIDIVVTYVIEDSKYVSIIEDVNYNVTGFKNMDLNRVKLFYPFVVPSDIKLNNLFKKEVLALSIDKDDMLIPSMKYIYIDDIDIKYDTNNITETFITRLDDDSDALDPTYLCYGEESMLNKALCNSPYDIDGNPKNSFTVWDKKCFKNEDCPFYKANKFYDNERGGCNDGICELPVGVKRIGYSGFNDKGYYNRAFCYNCEDDDEKCCNKDVIADFAFAGDFEKREYLGKSTIISKMDYKY